MNGAYAQSHGDEISLLTFQREMNGYTLSTFYQDAMAALSVALLTVPQAMAYALLAGLPLMTGIFAAVYSSILATLFGSSRHLIVGPSNALAILVQSGTAEILFTFYRTLEGPEKLAMSLMILTQLTMLVGFFQVIGAICKLGRLTQFVSHSVIVGYISGTALAVIINQLFTFVGVGGMTGDSSLYEKGTYLITHIKQGHWPTAAIGLGTLVLLILLKRINKKIPAPVISLVCAAVAIYVLRLDIFPWSGVEGWNVVPWMDVKLVGDMGELQSLLPAVAWPFFDMTLMNHLLPVAFAIALLNVMETTSVAKTIAASSGQRLSTNQEIFGIGIGNLLSSLITAMPVSGSPSRTTLNYSMGGQTRVAGILAAVFVGCFVYMFGFLITSIPLAALSALLLVTATSIVQPRQFLLCAKATSADAFVLWTTLCSCIFFSLDVAFYIGVVVSIILYLKKSSTPQLVEYEIDDDGELHNVDEAKQSEQKAVRVIKVEGELFFGAADLFQTTLKTIAEDDTSSKVIILQMKNARDIDATVCLALQQLHEYLRNSGRFLVACGLTQQIWDVMSDSGMVEEMGKENLFIFDERHPHLHMLKAYHRAKELIYLSKEETATTVREPIGELSATLQTGAARK